MAERKQKSIILSEYVIDVLLKLPNDAMARVMKAILCRELEREIPELGPMESAIYTLIVAHMND